MSANPAIAPHHTGPRSAQYVERRQNNRQALEATGVVSEQNDKKLHGHLQVTLKNISPTGVGFGSPVAFRPGSVYAMRIGTGTVHLKAKLQIVSSRPHPNGTFAVGAKFV